MSLIIWFCIKSIFVHFTAGRVHVNVLAKIWISGMSDKSTKPEEIFENAENSEIS